MDQGFPQWPAIQGEQPFRERADAVRLLNLRRGDIAHGVPVTPKVGRVLIDELLEDVVNDYKHE